MKVKAVCLAIIAMLASPAWALSLGLVTQENHPDNAAAPNYEAGGYTSRQLGNDRHVRSGWPTSILSLCK